ncbi:amidase [Neisseria sp. HSC-16F19]|nr:amidase [Neisseria sp. HSC-16F19]MCP2041463.1 amidase [Neisseria sp. HSC-16F19]
MDTLEYRRHDATALAQLIARGEVSREEVLQAALARLDEVNPQLNLLAQDLRHTLAQQSHSSGPFAGVPFLLKDLLADMRGIATGSGNRLLATLPAAADSDMVTAYRRAGLVIIGKTTVPEWGLNPYTESEHYGLTRNPWHAGHTPGGSSGGAAAAVAAQVVPAAHGGDGGGSIRIPAANCGVFGLKPSRGRSSIGPVYTDSWQGLVAEHVLTRSVRDSAALLDIAAAAPYSKPPLYHCPTPPLSFSGSLQQPLPRLSIAVCDTPWLGGEVAPAVRAAHADTVALLQSLGHNVESARPAFAPPEILARAMMVLIAGEAAKTAQQLQQRIGRRLRHDDVEAATWVLIVRGRQLSAGEAYWARDVVLEQAHIAAEFHRRHAVLCTPVLPQLPPAVGGLALPPMQQQLTRWLFGRLHLGVLARNNPIIENQALRLMQHIGFTVPFNMSGQPAMSVPLYWHENTLPVGSQFVAAHGQEALLLQLAQELEQARPWFHRTPPL